MVVQQHGLRILFTDLLPVRCCFQWVTLEAIDQLAIDSMVVHQHGLKMVFYWSFICTVLPLVSTTTSVWPTLKFVCIDSTVVQLGLRKCLLNPKYICNFCNYSQSKVKPFIVYLYIPTQNYPGLWHIGDGLKHLITDFYTHLFT